MGKILAAYGGGFKPPTGGHFEIVKRALQEFPEIDEFTVFVGGKVRDGIEQTEAVLVWDIYKRYLANKVKIEPVKSPIGEILRLAKNNPQDIIYFVIGYRQGRQDDLDDVDARTGDLEKKYPNIVVKVIPTYDPNMSGTNARAALNKSEKEFIEFLPPEVKEKSEIYSILRPPTNEILKLEENTTYANHIDYKQQISDLTDHMLEMGLNIEPLPKVLFKHDDIENAKDFFGKTAYYDPNTKEIVLYTEGRHPKDVARSFAHEMIHHIQNLENRIGNIQTTDTNADENLDAIEREAYVEGNMIFRNWTDSIDGDISSTISENKDYFGLNKFINEVADEILNEGKYDSLVTKLAGYTLNAWKGDFNDGQNKGQFYLDIGPGKEFDYPYLEFKYKAIATFGGMYNDSSFARPLVPEVVIKMTLDIEELPRMWEQISMDLRNTIRHEIEHLMQSGPNVKKGKEKGKDYEERQEIKSGKKKWWKIWRKTLGTPDYYKLEKEVDANLQGLYLKAKKQRTPLKNVIDNYVKYTLNLPVDEQEEVKRIWAERAPALNIPLEEGRKKKKDPKKGTGKKPEGSSRRLYTDEDPKDTIGIKFSTRQDIVDTLNKKSFKAKSHARQSQIINLIHQRVRAAYGRSKDPKVRKRLKTALDYAEKRKEASKAKTQRLKKKKIKEGDTYEKMSAKGKKAGSLKQGTVRKRLKIPKGKKIPLSLINKELSRLKKMDKDDKKKGVQLGDKNQKYYKALQLSKTLKTTTNVNEDLEKIRTKYKIFSDMDGVITDFDQSFKKYSDGLAPADYEKKFGKEKFWELIDGKGKVGFWVGMPWMEDGKQYWDYIKDYDVELLSSPSRSSTSRLGKRLWVRNNLPGIKLTLAQAAKKQNYAAPNHILIDDRKSNIEQWRSQGGIGILHTSAADTINQLKKLGL